MVRKKTRRITHAGARQKGHSFERFVANALKKVFPEARRQLEYQTSEAKGYDIANTGKYFIQCKRNRKYASLKMIEQVQICPIEGGIPVLITKGDDKEPLACIPFDIFLQLLRKEKLANALRGR